MDFLFVENKPFNTTSIHREGGGVRGGGEEVELLLATKEMERNI